MVAGNSFKKVDFHLHTPKSACYSEKSVTLEQIIDTAKANGLEAIAVTDHNTFEAVDELRQIGSRKGLVVFPGVELSARGGHIVALFEIDSPAEKLEDFLDYARVDRSRRGDGTAIIGDTVEEVLPKIEERGGIAIAAHIERWPSGFLETSEPRKVKMRIHSNQSLSALEITIPQNKFLWNNGQLRDFPKKYACIQGSDAHALEEIGRRPVYIGMETINLAAFRAALCDYDSKIVFPDGTASK